MRYDRKPHSGEQGIILLMALFIITLFTVLVLEFNYTTRVEYQLAHTVRDELLALNIAKAGIYEAIALLRDDRLKDIEDKEEENEEKGRIPAMTPTPIPEEQKGKLPILGVPRDINFPDYYGEDWGSGCYMEQFGEGFLTFKVIDESGKININTLMKVIKPVTLAVTPTPLAGEGTPEEAQEEPTPTRPPRYWGQKDSDWMEEAGSAEKAPEEGESTTPEQQPDRYIVDKNVENVIMRLIKVLDVRGVDPEDLTPAIVDWMDSNDEGEWEDDAYGRSAGPLPKNAPLDVLSELLMIQGVTGDLYFGPGQAEVPLLDEVLSPKGERKKSQAGLRDCLTVCSLAKVNVNTAPPEVLSALLDEENEELVKDIESYTKKDYFKDVADFADKMGEAVPASFRARIGVGSDSFQIISEGQVNEVTRQVRAYVYRDDEANVRFLYWTID
ncbi:MAG: type II secretion system protein GspK [Candidatus Aureabacteria bacterium]|nr:type II secretion system protein GspK [Candidatus Auribacterota bacterium]